MASVAPAPACRRRSHQVAVHLLEHRFEHSGLGREVVIEGACRDSRLAGDVLNRGGGEAAPAEQHTAGRYQGSPRLCHLLSPERGARIRRPGPCGAIGHLHCVAHGRTLCTLTRGDIVTLSRRASTILRRDTDAGVCSRRSVPTGRALIDICGRLTDAQWQAPSGCAGWSVQDVVAHLANLFWMVVDPGQLPDTAGQPDRARTGHRRGGHAGDCRRPMCWLTTSRSAKSA